MHCSVFLLNLNWVPKCFLFLAGGFLIGILFAPKGRRFFQRHTLPLSSLCTLLLPWDHFATHLQTCKSFKLYCLLSLGILQFKINLLSLDRVDKILHLVIDDILSLHGVKWKTDSLLYVRYCTKVKWLADLTWIWSLPKTLSFFVIQSRDCTFKNPSKDDQKQPQNIQSSQQIILKLGREGSNVLIWLEISLLVCQFVTQYLPTNNVWWEHQHPEANKL